MDLRNTKRQLVDLLKEQLSIIGGGYPVAKLGDVYEAAAVCFQAVGCSNLLISADKGGFYKNLIWAGFTRRHFLKRSVAERGTDDFHLARSRCESFFCAVAAGDLPLALEIGDLSPRGWMPDGEYDDDFSYHFFLYLLLKGGDAQPRAAALEKFEEALQGVESPRFDICKALHAVSAAEFEAAFRALIEERVAWAEDGGDLFSDDATFAPRSHIFVEGLALLRIAENLRIEPRQREHAMCPLIARGAPLAARPDDLLMEVERAIRG